LVTPVSSKVGSNSGWSRLVSSTPSRVSTLLARAIGPSHHVRRGRPSPPTGFEVVQLDTGEGAVGGGGGHPGEGGHAAAVGGGAGLSSRSPEGATVSQGMWLCPNTSTSTSGWAPRSAAPARSRRRSRAPPRSGPRRPPPGPPRAAGPAAPGRRCCRTPRPAGGPLLQPVQQVDLDPVAGVHHDVGRVDRRPDRPGKILRPPRQVGVGDQQQVRHGPSRLRCRGATTTGRERKPVLGHCSPLTGGQLTPTRSTTKMRVSWGLMAPPAPRSP
jgi:hypothetical protein